MLKETSLCLLTSLVVACGGTSPETRPEASVPADALAMSVRQVARVPAGIAIVGRVMHGVARAPADVDLLGFGDPIRVRIAALDQGGNLVSEVVAGQDAAALLVGVDLARVRVGQVLSTPGTYFATRTYTADFVLAKDLENPERNLPAFAPYPIEIAGVKGTFHTAKSGDPLSYETATRGTLVLEQAIVLLPFTSTIMWGGAIVGDLTILGAVR